MSHFSEKHLDKLASFYNQKNKFAVYSHSIDRFVIINEISFFETHTLSKILSSKISTQTIILNPSIPINSDNCLEYSIFNKDIVSTKTQIAAYPMKQIEIPLFIKDKSKIYKKNIGRDSDVEKLQSYAIFCLKVIYAIYIADSLRNTYPIGEILESFGINDLAECLSIKYDYSNSNIGIKKEILKILYMSEDNDQAEDRIKKLWIEQGQNLKGYRQYFYYYLNQEEPVELQTLLYDQNNFSRKLC